MHETANDDGELWRRLDWNDVRIFLAVAESGSLNAAARILGMTQPTISRRMEDLEYRLGARLFERSSRGVTMTVAGDRVRDLAISMAHFGDSIVRSVGGSDKSLSGRVRVAAPDGLAGFILMPHLATFQMANPEIDLAIDCGLWHESPLEGETDLTLTMSDVCPADMVSVPIATLHYALFASADYLKLYGTPTSMADAATHRWVRHPSHKEQLNTWTPKAIALGELAGQHHHPDGDQARRWRRLDADLRARFRTQPGDARPRRHVTSGALPALPPGVGEPGPGAAGAGVDHQRVRSSRSPLVSRGVHPSARFCPSEGLRSPPKGRGRLKTPVPREINP
jgi:DNA-binding transcriptional LysR family regulator